jgi:glycine cleavage system regulatory protein
LRNKWKEIAYIFFLKKKRFNVEKMSSNAADQPEQPEAAATATATATTTTTSLSVVDDELAALSARLSAPDAILEEATLDSDVRQFVAHGGEPEVKQNY